MAGTTFAQTMRSAVLGKVEKARLYIISPAESGFAAEKVDAARRALQNGSNSLLSAGVDGLCELTVQYNPSSISFECNAQAMAFPTLQQGTTPNIPVQNNRPPNVVMSVELIFDDVNQQDAFLSDKAALTPGSLAADIGALKRVHSVQAQTDAFVALLLRPETRTVNFAWADLSFTGRVSEVQANYVMFSPSGRPIRSKVHLKLTQSIENKDGDGYWDRVLDEVFSGEGPLGGAKKAQELGAVLNFDAF